MEEFRITEDGVLVHDITHTEDEGSPKDEGGKGGFPSFPSWRIVVDEKDVKEDFTGIVNFYAWERDLSTKDNHAFLEYAALFEKGVMQAVICVPEGVAAEEIEPYLRKTLKEKERGRWLMDMANLNCLDFSP